MNDRTPTTDDIDEALRFFTERSLVMEGMTDRAMAKKMVDNWLEQVKAEAWDEGRHAGQYNEHEYRPGRSMTNPYRQETDA